MVPFKDNKTGTKVAQFQLGYKGYIQLAIRSGQYKKLNVLAIKKGELIRFDPLNEDIEVNLISDENEREKAETIGYYAMFEYVNGFRKAMYWSKEKMKAHAVKYSQGYASDLKKGTKWTFWSKDFDGMAYKTMLRQIISKWGIMSIDLQTALDSDMTVINEDGTHTYVETTPVEQSEDETYEEVVEQTAEQTVEETESVPEGKKTMRNRLKKGSDRIKAILQLLKTDSHKSKYISQNCKTLSPEWWQAERRRDNEHFRLHPFRKGQCDFKKKLEKVTGLSDRDIREEIAMARRNTVILNLSNGQGYFQPIEGEEDKLVIKYYKQESSRLKRIGWSLLATRKRVREIQNGS